MNSRLKWSIVIEEAKNFGEKFHCVIEKLLEEVVASTKNELINDWLLENRYGIKYDGKSKNLPKSWKNYKGDQQLEDYEEAYN